jgi:peptidylprolyl isomerase
MAATGRLLDCGVMPRRLLAILVLVPAIALAACGGDEQPASGAAATSGPTPDATAFVDALAAEISKDTKVKPTIPVPEGAAPARLVKRDIVPGTGARARKGDKVSVQYAGTAYSTGSEFDTSWTRGEPFQFAIGGQQVIAGWDRGVAGMREGGRRLLVIPPDLGYGPQGSPPAIGPDETLIFVVDLVKVG